jgi:hypothetical protein
MTYYKLISTNGLYVLMKASFSVVAGDNKSGR